MADFTFPATATTAAATTMAEPPAVVVASPLPACGPLPFPRFPVPPAASSSPPPCRFPPASPPPAGATAVPPVTTTSRALTPTLTAMAAAAQQGAPPGAGGDDAAAAAAAVLAEDEEEDRMDLLWEDFNEELARGGSCSCRAAAGGGRLHARDLWSSSRSESSDADSEPAAARGCAPVLRPSSRAGGAVRHCRRRAGTWVLLMRIFRRLFVVDKTRDRLRGRARARQAAPRRCRDDGELVMPACLQQPPRPRRRLPP